MSQEISALQRARASYKPKLPRALRQAGISVELGPPAHPPTHQDEIKAQFPNTYGQPVATIVAGTGGLADQPLKVGVVLSGGQAPGGHNVIAGLFDALKAANAESQLFGFLKGPKGVVKGKFKELTADVIEPYRNTGGFDMIMSGRDKIEKDEEKEACARNFESMGLDGLVIIGGDDSNTNAALLAEYLKANGSQTCIIGVPKTIDGDLKNDQIEASFGFDTACKVYSELIGNICRDATSAVKYWHFIRLMGRAASHVALECALQTHPNITIISEEIRHRGDSLAQVVQYVFDIVVKRAKEGKNYGIVVLPEGLPEFIPEIKQMIDELHVILGRNKREGERKIASLPSHEDRVQYLVGQPEFSDHSARVYQSLPLDIQEVLLTLDPHGNVRLSQVETERLLIDLVSDKIRDMNAAIERENEGKPDDEKRPTVSFSPLSHFFGYEGRCAAPTNFDADYTYSLGYAAAQLIRARLSGYTVNVRNLTKSPDEWIAGGVPVTMMLHMELRTGERTPVIKKALVDLDGAPFKEFAAHRESWEMNDDYVYPGPIQYFGPSELCDATTKTLALESR